MTKNAEDMIKWWVDSYRRDDNVTVKNVFFSGRSAKAQNDDAIELFKFVFKQLDWTPRDVANRVSKDVLKDLNLFSVYKRLLIPKEITKLSNPWWYIAVLCYPEVYKREFTDEYTWLVLYINELNTNRKKDVSIVKDPIRGLRQAKFLLSFYMQRHRNEEWTNLRRTYQFFASPKGAKFIADARLRKALGQFFVSPLQYFHESLPEGERSDMLHQFAEFEVRKNAKPKRTKPKKTNPKKNV